MESRVRVALLLAAQAYGPDSGCHMSWTEWADELHYHYPLLFLNDSVA